MIGLTVELWNPGAILPGVAGGLSLLLAFFAFQILPVNTSGLLLIAFGLALLILELKVPSFGALGVGGAASLMIGSLMLTRDVPGVSLGLGLIVPAVLTVAGIVLLLGRLALAAHRQPASTGADALLGQHGAHAHGGLGRSRTGRRPRRNLARHERHPDRGGQNGSDPRPQRADAHRRTRRNAHSRRRSRMENLTISPLLVIAVIVVLYVLTSIQILPEYERGVIFRLGKLLPAPKGPGVVLVFRPIDRIVRISLRTVVHDVPPQDIITRDNVSVKVNAVVFFRVVDAPRAVVEVENYIYATSQLAQTTLRSVLGQAELDDLLAERDRLNQQLQQILDHQTDPWGIKVSAVEVKHVDLPENMQRAMGRQAEAEREKRAKIIHAEGELIASDKLAQAAAIIDREPAAITLRYLQTLTEIGAEKNSTIIFPLPIEMMRMMKVASEKS